MKTVLYINKSFVMRPNWAYMIFVSVVIVYDVVVDVISVVFNLVFVFSVFIDGFASAASISLFLLQWFHHTSLSHQLMLSTETPLDSNYLSF